MKQSVFRLSSLSHKSVLALAGLFLMLFLIFHLLTNLLMLLGDGGEAFDKAVAFLSANPLIKVIEYVLFAGFIIHILLGTIIWFTNQRARPVGYYVALKSDTSLFSKFMFHTGVIIFVFLVIHLVNFFFVKLGLVAVPDYARHAHDFYAVAVVLFKDPLYSAIYLVCFVFLGFPPEACVSVGVSVAWFEPQQVFACH
jgi:succinate dehydrogenase / fumarate reductase, cytochrome b subunit